MYQKYYNLSAEPFRLSPEHGFAYSHKGYTKARAYMDYAFMRAEGFVMITGRPGTGKTTLIGALVDDLANTPVSIANLVCTQLQADDLLKIVAYEFGIPESVVEKGELLQRLTRQLKTWHRDGRRALLIVDEAQDLSVSAMEELRLLTNIQVESRPLLQIFLLGQPELRELILSPRLEQVHQRIIAASHMQPLEKDETEAYIRHRLEIVRWRGDPAISRAVYPLVYKFSEGIPRRINLICSRLLLHCAVEDRHQVTVADVREVVQELQSEKLASGDSFAESDFQVKDVFDEVIPERNDPGEQEKGNVKKEAMRKEAENRLREAGAQTQRRAASGTGQVAPVSELRRRPAQNGAVSTRASQAANQEIKKKSPPRPAVKADRAPGRQPDSASARQRKSRSIWGVLLDWSILITCSILVVLLVASIIIIYAPWI
ncbi:MAG: AAA family ATPase [Gammaproteobacteria bacterium]|jgi:putative secretion ATPase (PEP-CTERM system associated)